MPTIYVVAYGSLGHVVIEADGEYYISPDCLNIGAVENGMDELLEEVALSPNEVVRAEIGMAIKAILSTPALTELNQCEKPGSWEYKFPANQALYSFFFPGIAQAREEKKNFSRKMEQINREKEAEKAHLHDAEVQAIFNKLTSQKVSRKDKK